MLILKDVNFKYSDNSFTLCRICFQAEEGSMLGIIGPNGAGKSTLLKVISGYFKLSSGEIFAEGKNIINLSPQEIAKIISFVPPEENFVFSFSVQEIIAMGRTPYLKRFHSATSKDIEIISKTIKEMELEHFRERTFFSLSSGEKQKVILARAIVQQTPIILLDEPTSHLDIKHQVEFFTLLKKLKKEGKTIILVSQDINLAATYCDKLVLMKEGTVYACGLTEEIIDEKNLSKVYNTPIEVFSCPLKKKKYIFAREENK